MYGADYLCLLLLLFFACSVVLHKRVPTRWRIRAQSCVGGFSATSSVDGTKQRSDVAGGRGGQGRVHGTVGPLGSHSVLPVPY